MTGTQFEREFCRELFQSGFWALNIPRDTCGAQPFDVIAVKGSKVVAVDCKVCGRNRFPLSRVEDNQWLAFRILSERCSRADVGIVCWCDGAIYYIPYHHLVSARDSGKASIVLDSYRAVLAQHVFFDAGAR